jgi:hypothetical protein
MKSYYESMGRDYTDSLPETYHIKHKSDLDFFFVNNAPDPKEPGEAPDSNPTTWILKPGENSNRGSRIKIFKSVLKMHRFV